MSLNNAAHQKRDDTRLMAQLGSNVRDVGEAEKDHRLTDGIVRNRPDVLEE